MTETKKLLEAYQLHLAPFGALEYSNFGFVSDFEFIQLRLAWQLR